MERAQQTAGIVAEQQERLSPHIDERIIEVLTPYEGRPTAELAALGWDLVHGQRAAL